MSRVTVVVVALAVVAAPAAAYAKKHTKSEREAAGAAPAAATPAQDAAEPTDDGAGRLTVSGRVFARETFASREAAAWTGDAELASARVAARYRWKKRLRAEVSLEAASGKAKLRDAYLTLSLGDGFWVRGGRFKLPISAIELTSTWTLPTMDRSFLSDVLDDGFQVAGRRVGFALGWQGKGDLDPRVEVGAFQSLDLAGAPAAGDLGDGAGLTYAGRASLALPPGLVLGVFGESRLEALATTGARARYWAVGADLEADLSRCGCGLRAWADVLAGSSPLDTTPATPAAPVFGAVRGIVAWRTGGAEVGERYLEPYAAAAMIDPNLDNAHDAVWSGALGVNLGRWRRYRVGVELERRRSYANRPATLGGASQDLADRDAVTVQLGAAF